MQVESIATGYGLVEGPVWHDERGLLFSDVQFGGVYAVNAHKDVSSVIAHRRGIGGMAIHTDGGLVVSGRNISLKKFGDTKSILLLDRDPDNGNVGYNDFTTDRAGRIYAGSLGSSPVFDDGLEPRAGNLYLIDLDGTSRIVADDVQLTNGLGFSPDGRTLYHADSRRQQVYRYDVKRDGELTPREIFCEFTNGAPDGLAIAEDGSVWIADANGGGVAVYEATGVRRRSFIEVPEPMCTSVCFGEAGLRTLYIVTGSNGVEGDRRGGVYRCETKVSGVPIPLARVRPSVSSP